MKLDSKSLREGSVFKSVIIYTIPIILTGWLQLLFNAADLIVIGWFRGSDSVAAVGATGALTNLIINLFIGLSVGGGVTVAQALGAGNKQDVSEAVHTTLFVAFISGIWLTFFGVMFSERFLILMGLLRESCFRVRLYICVFIFAE